MKFYDRESELELLEKVIKGKGTCIVVIRGFRRIGKTRLVLESLKGKEYLRIFVPKDKTPTSFLIEVSEKYNLPKFTTLRDLINYIFDRYELIFFDEFQNFQYIDKSFFSELQDIIDEYKRKSKKLCLFISGSSYSLLKKIFYDYATALYGRKDLEIFLFELDIKTIMRIFSDLGIRSTEDKIKLWAIFGGVPKYYEMLESLNINNFKEFIDLFYIKNFKSLLEEGKTILISELGGEYKTYYTVMEAIAFSKNKISEIASLFNNDTNAVNRYLDLLIKEYDLVNKFSPLIGKDKKITRYKNKSNFFDFWFRFVRKYGDSYDIGEFERIIKDFDKEFNLYMGRKFEDFIIMLFNCALLKKLNFMKVGKQWGKFKGEKGKNTYEIDVVALNEKTKEILFGECKWQDKVDAEKTLGELNEKAKHVKWNNEKRKECLAVFAKSFKKKIDEFQGKKVYCFDLKDIEKNLPKK